MLADLARHCRQFVALAFVGLATSVSPAVADSNAPTVLEVRVSKVLDGDTFTLSGHSRRIRVSTAEGGGSGRGDGARTLAAQKLLVRLM